MKNSNWFWHHFFLLRRNAWRVGIVLAPLLQFCCVATADPQQQTNDNAASAQISVPLKNPATPQTSSTTSASYCPSPGLLKKHGDYWVGPDGWVSYYQSFIVSIDKFIDAHWVGVGVGKIICRYGTVNSNSQDFPISLENSSQFVQKPLADPHKNNWGKEIKGVMNCISTTPSDCPFYYAPQNNNIDYKKLLTIPDAQKDNTPIQGTIY